jgi:hypothetical protein
VYNKNLEWYDMMCERHQWYMEKVKSIEWRIRGAHSLRRKEYILQHEIFVERATKAGSMCEMDGDTIDDIYTYSQIVELVEGGDLDRDSDIE